MASVDTFRMDNHKLMFHPHRVSAWLAGEDIYPLYVEISPTGSCNQRCTFCALDYLGYHASSLDTKLLMERISEMGRLGVKSIMFAGEGEPLLHPDLADLVNHAGSAGLDVALTTNGTLLQGDLFRRMASGLSWIKVSINAGTAATYAKLHRTSAQQFDTVLENLAGAVAIRQDLECSCAIGAQMILLPENAAEMEILAGRVREIGVDYLVVKPFSQHNRSISREYEELDYSTYLEMGERLQFLNDDRFRIVFRSNAMLKSQRRHRGYERCLALPFWAYLDSSGNLWGCSTHIGDERFCFGNIMADSFGQIWVGVRRRELMTAMKDFELGVCRRNCRMDEINRYLWELTHPMHHVNFI